jgi:hypothetical protein
MWQIILIMMILVFIRYLLPSGRHIPETHHQLSGSSPWQHPDNAHLKIRNTDICTTIQGCKDILMSTWRGKKFAGWEDPIPREDIVASDY